MGMLPGFLYPWDIATKSISACCCGFDTADFIFRAQYDTCPTLPLSVYGVSIISQMTEPVPSMARFSLCIIIKRIPSDVYAELN